MSRNDEVIGVAELARRLRGAVERSSGREWVEGEVSGVRRAASGHVYFALKDEREDAVIDCVMYRSRAQLARRILDDGARVQLWGRCTVWAPRGRLQMVCDRARPAGRGALLEALEKLKEKLRAEGLFEAERKRELPRSARVVGVVTSRSGAAIHDITSVAFRRGGARIVLSPALVQGDGAPRSLLAALDLLERHSELDVIIIGRGGGSGEDLLAFSDERVVRRVAACRVPVVSAVGHEIDTTLTDLVADVRAATPSQAAELVIEDRSARLRELVAVSQRLMRAGRARLRDDRSTLADLRGRLGDPRLALAERQQLIDDHEDALARWSTRTASSQRARVEQLSQRLSARHPSAVLRRSRQQLEPLAQRAREALRQRLQREVADSDDVQRRLCAALRAELATRHEQLGADALKLDALSPLRVLERGYAIVTRADGRAVRRAVDVAPGVTLDVRVRDGSLSATVTAVRPEGAEEHR